MILTGWKVGLRKISLAHLIRELAGVSLASAKAKVDDLLGGKSVEIPILSGHAEHRVIDEIESLGAEAVIGRLREPVY